ncbi:MAG: hypothetical protein U9R25_02040 [Chloroflexota bacterium]|nr:hypothetical protein [Chloroflexota bacterium]
MNEQKPLTPETTDQTSAELTQLGWGSWALWVLGLAVAGAVSYRLGAVAPLAVLTLPPVAIMLFGILAGGVYGFVLRQQFPPARRWILASSLAAVVAACVSVVTTSLAETSASLLAGWAFAWAAYGALFGVMLQRIFPNRWLMLASLAAWTSAGILSGAVGWALEVFLVTETIPTSAFFDLPTRTWSTGGLALMGAVLGATGGAITGATLVLLSRVPTLPQGDELSEARDRRLVVVAGGISGLIAAALCVYTAPLVITKLIEGSLDSLDLTIYFLSALGSTPLCLPTIAVVTIPLAVGGAHAGLEIARVNGRTDSRAWIWSGAAIGGVAGYLLGFLVAFAIGHQ